MFVITRFIEGICLNPKEYILDDNGLIKEFPTPEDAVQYLNEITNHIQTREDYEEDGIYIEEVTQ